MFHGHMTQDGSGCFRMVHLLKRHLGGQGLTEGIHKGNYFRGAQHLDKVRR